MKKTEYKKIAFKADEYDEGTGIFSGYAAVFSNVDTGGDIVEPGAFTKALEEGIERVKILSGHADWMLPIGKPLELREDKVGLYIKAQISDTTMGRDIKQLLKDNVLSELSIGYDPIVFDYDEDRIRHLREVKLWEVSVVTWAMNPEAVITDYKAAEMATNAAKLASATAQECKEGQPLSEERLKVLREASITMKSATRELDALIRKAEGNKSGRYVRQIKTVSPKPYIEITL